MLRAAPKCFDVASGTFEASAALAVSGEEEFRAEVLGVVGVAVTRNLVREAVAALKTCAGRRDFDLGPLLCDGLWLWTAVLDPQRQRDEWRALTALIGEVRAERLCGEDALRTHLEVPALVESRLCSKGETAEVLSKRLTRVRTVLVFKQQKYNLMREETEGYAR